MRSLGPLPLTLERSTPSSRANARTDGEACAFLKLSLSMGAAAGVSRFAGGASGLVGARGASAGAEAGLAGTAAAVAGAAAPAASSVRITLPSLNLSPSLTLTSFTVPAAGEGTSIVALSDSSVINGSSAFTASPALTKTSITGTSLKSPISGTLTGITPAAAGADAAAGGAEVFVGAGAAALAGAAGEGALAAAPAAASVRITLPSL